MSLEFSNPGFNILDTSTYYGGVDAAPDYGLPTTYSEPIATSWGALEPLGKLADNAGKIFGSVTGAVNTFQAAKNQLQAQRDSFQLQRENAALIRDTRQAELELVRSQGRDMIDVAKIRAAVEVAKSQNELSRATAIDKIYAQNPLYAIAGTPAAAGFDTVIVWVLLALGGFGIWLASRK